MQALNDTEWDDPLEAVVSNMELADQFIPVIPVDRAPYSLEGYCGQEPRDFDIADLADAGLRGSPAPCHGKPIRLESGESVAPPRALYACGFCGGDDRIPLRGSEPHNPFYCFCRIVVTYVAGGAQRQTQVSGVMVGKRVVLTAGHCVYFESLKRWILRAEVAPIYHGSGPSQYGYPAPYGIHLSTRFVSVRGWAENENDEYDYGAIIMPNDDMFNRVNAFLGVKDVNDNMYSLSHVGWPYNDSYHRPYFELPTSELCPPQPARLIRTRADACQGQSGGPLFDYSYPGTVYGVLSHGDCGGGASGFNYFTRLTPRRIANIEHWRML